MQVLNCQMGAWKADAAVEKIAHDKLMAIIHVWDQHDAERANSHHTVVFDYKSGSDAIEETQAMMHKLLGHRYGA
jgi:hypothetical protein